MSADVDTSGEVIIRKRPAFARAIRYTGSNHAEIIAWSHGHAYEAEGGTLYIETLRRGDVPADPGDWVILGLVANDYYPIGVEEFEAGWELVGEGS